MKIIIIPLILLLSYSSVYSQEFTWDLTPVYPRAISKDTLVDANTLSDIHPRYPASWVNTYSSVEIETTCNGVVKKAQAKDAVLTKEQKSILQQADSGSDINVEVKYNPKNSLNDDKDIKEIKFSYTVKPDIEAQYLGGESAMRKYFKDNALSKIQDSELKEFKFVDYSFVVDESGAVTEVELRNPTDNEKVNKLIYDTICEMPKWKPAQTMRGKKLKTLFWFTAGWDREISCMMNLGPI